MSGVSKALLPALKSKQEELVIYSGVPGCPGQPGEHQTLVREEVKLVPKEETTNGLAMGCLCEVSRTLEGGYCERAGEVELGGVLLCGRHARQFEARDRVDLLRGIASSLELALRSIPLHRDVSHASLLRTERAGAARDLNLAYEELRRAVEEIA